MDKCTKLHNFDTHINVLLWKHLLSLEVKSLVRNKNSYKFSQFYPKIVHITFVFKLKL